MSAPFGHTFGRLTVYGEVSSSPSRSKRWLCVCDCGNVCYPLASNIRAGRTTSCNNHGHGKSTGRRPQLRVSYGSMHVRLRKLRGRAAEYMCADGCGREAVHWSYDYTDADALWGLHKGLEMPYSLDPKHYSPRCRSCHSILDMAMGKSRRQLP